MHRVRQKTHAKRTLGKVELNLTPDCKVAIRFFATVKETKRPTTTLVHAVTSKPLKSSTRYICEETGAILWDHQIGTYAEVGNEKVKFTKEEMSKIKKFETPGMTLMGFKPIERIKPWHNIRSS
jgi:ATP-dependent DNA helicase 2 subunit 1